MKIRKATIKDLGAIAKLFCEYTRYEHNLDKKVKLEKLANIKKEERKHIKTGTIYFVVEKDKEIIGCLNATIDRRGKSNIGVIHNLVITKKFRGKGYGDALVKYVKNYLKKQGCERARTFVFLNNKKAKKFWTKRGFNLDLGYSGSCKLS
ncbi:MAG: GNAT family N-acetyltransferase [Nanoarchaeota archaeon]|nr:GNAT family N-acetyltransferase [Nanoarchaeota archaeon]